MSKKTTKRALAMSFVSVFLCVCMLVGTTFAWFTDSVTSSNNIIKSGTLDVTMEWKDATTTGAQQSYKDASEGAIFDYDLWEPGYVEAKNIQIKNAGTLALKYQLNIVANGEPSDLTDVIDVYYVDGETVMNERADMSALTHLGTLTEVLADMSTTASGNLEANAAHTVTIALKMQESATNEYQNKSIGSDFSVVLMATQKDYESDSFDSTYDKIEVPEMDIKVIDGNTYYYLNDGNVVLRSVPYGNVGSSFTVRNDVTLLGIGVDKGDTNGPVFSKSSPVETLTLNEGLVKINARAVTGVKTLTSVNFPSTLKFIGEQAFAQAGMTSLTIPANVEEIKFGAFRDMAKLTTVTVEGNVAFDDYAFRSCPNLTSIYLLGDDVTFTGSQFATHTDAGDANGITIYVKNATVAARVYAAQSSAYGYEVKVLGAAADGSDAVPVETVNNTADLQTAITSGNNVLLTGDVTYGSAISNNANINLNGNTFEATGTLNLGNNADLTMTGGDYEVNGTYGHVDVRPSTAEGSEVVFEDVNFSFNKLSKSYVCTDRLGSVVEVCATATDAKTVITFKNCTFDNAMVLFEGLSGTVGEFEATFENCTFNALTSSAPIQVQNYVKGTIKVVGCTFNLTCTSSSASAISVSPSSSTTVTVTAENNTINAVAATPYTHNSAAGETDVDDIKVSGTPANIKFISAYANTTVNETNTTKIGIAG